MSTLITQGFSTLSNLLVWSYEDLDGFSTAGICYASTLLSRRMHPVSGLHSSNTIFIRFFFFFDKVLPFPISNKALLLDSTPSFTPNIAPSLPIATCSSHISRPPSYLHDYHCSLISSIRPSTSHPLSQVLGYEKLSPITKVLIMPCPPTLNSVPTQRLLLFKSGKKPWMRS